MTQISNSNALLSGHGTLYLGASFASLVSLGLFTNLKIEHLAKTQTLRLDGVGEVVRFQDGNRYQLSFLLGEISPQIWSLASGGLVSVVSGTGTQTVTFAQGGFLQSCVARFVQTDASGNALTLDLTNVSNITGLTIELPENREDVATQEMQLTGTLVQITDNITVA